jgi:hypothetical protein
MQVFRGPQWSVSFANEIIIVAQEEIERGAELTIWDHSIEDALMMFGTELFVKASPRDSEKSVNAAAVNQRLGNECEGEIGM